MVAASARTGHARVPSTKLAHPFRVAIASGLQKHRAERLAAPATGFNCVAVWAQGNHMFGMIQATSREVMYMIDFKDGLTTVR